MVLVPAQDRRPRPGDLIERNQRDVVADQHPDARFSALAHRRSVGGFPPFFGSAGVSVGLAPPASRLTIASVCPQMTCQTIGSATSRSGAPMGPPRDARPLRAASKLAI
jgi:hypothetical protein